MLLVFMPLSLLFSYSHAETITLQPKQKSSFTTSIVAIIEHNEVNTMVQHFKTDKYEHQEYSSSIISTKQKNRPGSYITIKRIPMQIVSCLTSNENKKFKLFLDAQSKVIRKRDTQEIPFSIRLNNHLLQPGGYIIISNTTSCDQENRYILSMIIEEDFIHHKREVYTGELSFSLQLLN